MMWPPGMFWERAVLLLIGGLEIDSSSLNGKAINWKTSRKTLKILNSSGWHPGCWWPRLVINSSLWGSCCREGRQLHGRNYVPSSTTWWWEKTSVPTPRYKRFSEQERHHFLEGLVHLSRIHSKRLASKVQALSELGLLIFLLERSDFDISKTLTFPCKGWSPR